MSGERAVPPTSLIKYVGVLMVKKVCIDTYLKLVNAEYLTEGLPHVDLDSLLYNLPSSIGEDHKFHGHLHISAGTRELGMWTVGYATMERRASEIFDHVDLCEALAMLWLHLKKEELI